MALFLALRIDYYCGGSLYYSLSEKKIYHRYEFVGSILDYVENHMMIIYFDEDPDLVNEQQLRVSFCLKQICDNVESITKCKIIKRDGNMYEDRCSYEPVYVGHISPESLATDFSICDNNKYFSDIDIEKILIKRRIWKKKN